MSLEPQPLSISPFVNHGINFGLGLDDLGIKIHLSVAIGVCLFRFSLEGQSSFPMVLSQFSSVIQSCLTLCDPMNRSTLGLPITNSRSSPKLMSVESVMPSSHLILCHPLLLIRVFSNESPSHEVAKYWSFSFSISPSNEHPGLISFWMDWLDLLAF